MLSSDVYLHSAGIEARRHRRGAGIPPRPSSQNRFIKTSAILMLVIASCAHGAETRPLHMTPDQFIAELRGGPNAQRFFDKPYALGYLAGVVDGAQGRSWCLPAGLKSSAADEQVLDELARRPKNSMPGTAAAVLLDVYREKFRSTGGSCASKPRLTGNEFSVWAIGNRRKSNEAKVHPSPEVEERERFADGYIGGVVDATQGADWCAPRRLKPSELAATGYWSLVDRPVGSMPGNAATLLHEHFIAKYPCRPQP